MSQADRAKKVLEHLGLKYSNLPEYLMDDKNKRTQLADEDDRVLAHFQEDTLWTLKTVRFLKDFQRYNAGVHLNTSNKSFKRTAELFRGMGVKNYYFMLQLNNPMLQDVDPWDENLDDVTKAMIHAECNENIWYIIREVIMIGGRRFRGNRAVLSFIWACLCHIPTTILMPRQSGKTVGMQVLAFIMQYFVGRGYRMGLITLAASNRMQFIEAIKKIRAGLPEYLINVTYKDKDAGNVLSYEAFGVENKNTFEVRVPSGGRDGAENVSRGATLEGLLYDEPAWTKFIEEIINGSGPATLTAQKEAREKGIPYFTAKATTPNSILKEEGAYMHRDFMESTEWREAFFDSFSESHLVHRLIKAAPVNTTSPKIGMMFTHLQLGLGHGWVKETMDKLGLSWSKAKIDLLMMWTEEGESKLFDDFTREKLSECKEDAVWNEEVNDTGLFIDWFVTKEGLTNFAEDPDEFILFGMDTSDANNRDAMTLVARRMKSGENLGVGRYPLAFADDVTEILKELLVRIPNSLLIIERNRAAHMIERLLLTLPAYDIDPFKRIFNDIIQDPIKYKAEYRDVMEIHFKHRSKEFYLKYKRFFGFYTGPQTRREMYGFIHEAVSLTGAGIRYKLLVDELIGLEVNKDGRIDHGNKTHDDLVVAWLLTYWFIKLGYNKSFYGIPQGMTMTQVITLKDNGDTPQYTKNQLEFFIKVKSRINDLTKELMTSTNNMIAERIETEIRKLSECIPKEMKKTITIDNIIEEAKTERSKRIVAKRSRFGSSVRFR
ncbi:terminase [Erwinia phage AH04]|uniref:Terminase n=1 Tax=Erwinia phage AH04 TaxID=2869569 RepID=A0AAE7X246_9CAUD|nr:terminase large subunit [Erwinia phage AH04]QZA70497.1 terminase [Erwinia phage AH04]